MSGIFNLDNPVWVFIGKLWDVFVLNALWVICCIPVVTIGASTTALYYVTLKLAANEEGYIVRSFFKSFKENFKQGTIIWLIMLVIGAILGIDYYFYISQAEISGIIGNILFVGFFSVLIIYLAVLSYVFPVLSKFNNTIKKTLVNSLYLAVRHLPWSIIILVMSIGILFLSVSYVPQLLIFVFGLIAFINSYLFMNIFKDYIPKDTSESIEALDNEAPPGNNKEI